MKTVKVAAAVIRSGEKIFATQRGYGEFKDGWEFPGGKIEPGETAQEALAREIFEELDARIRVGDLIDTIEYEYPTFHLSMDCFWCEPMSETFVLKEHEAARWLSASELDSVEWLPADVTLIERIRASLAEQVPAAGAAAAAEKGGETMSEKITVEENGMKKQEAEPVSAGTVVDAADAGSMEAAPMGALEAIFTRRSTRSFTDQPVEEEKIQTILRAGMSGPSCRNLRDWAFLVVKDPQTLGAMADANAGPAEPLRGAAFGILILGDYERAHASEKEYWVIDGSIAAQNMTLAAHALGLGSVWLGTWPVKARVERQSALFNLPDGMIPHSIIAFGYPKDPVFEERDQTEPEKVHYEKW